MLRIRDFFIPDPNFLHPGSQIPDPESASKNLSILTQKIVYKHSEIWSGLFIQDPDPGYRGQKSTGSRIRICKTGNKLSLTKGSCPWLLLLQYWTGGSDLSSSFCTCISSENQWVRGSFLLTSSSRYQWVRGSFLLTAVAVVTNEWEEAFFWPIAVVTNEWEEAFFWTVAVVTNEWEEAFFWPIAVVTNEWEEAFFWPIAVIDLCCDT